VVSKGNIGVVITVATLALAYILLARPESVNFTIGFNITDARGRSLAGSDDQQPVVTILFGNTTLQKRCLSCLFDIKNIELINGTANFRFNLTVAWLGRQVYYHSEALPIDSSVNNTLVKILNGIIKINAINLEVYGVNDENERLSGCLIEVRELKAQVRCGQTIALPFGAYSVANASYEIAPNKWVKVPVLTNTLYVSNTTLTAQVTIGVAGSFSIDVLRADGSPLSGAGIELVYVSVENVTVFRGVTQGAPIRLRNIPYGRYLVTVTWKGERLLQTLVQVDRTVRNVTLTTRIIPTVALTVLDADRQPITGLTLRIVGPARDTLASTDASGRILIQDVVEGLYTLSLTWMNRTITRQVYVRPGDVFVDLPLRRLTLKLTPNARCGDRCTLPPGLTVRVLYRNAVLVEDVTDHPTSTAEFALPNYVLTDELLKLEVSWNGTLLMVHSFTPFERVMVFELRFFELSIKITDARGNPLPRALVVITDSLGKRRFASDVQGLIEARYLYGDTALIEVIWSNITVGKHVADAASEQITLNTYVYPMLVEVEGVLGPVANAQATVVVMGFDYSFNTSAITGYDGRVEMKVPFLPGSNSTLTVTKGRITSQRLLSLRDLTSGDPVKVKLDLLVDYGWIQLRTGELIVLSTALAISLAAFLFAYRYISTRRAVKHVFITYGGELEEEEERGRGVFSRLKGVFEAEREEEEEEEEFFYEEF